MVWTCWPGKTTVGGKNLPDPEQVANTGVFTVTTRTNLNDKEQFFYYTVNNNIWDKSGIVFIPDFVYSSIIKRF